MHYAHFKKLGMFIGSGAVEAGCKSIVGQRCKLSGMKMIQEATASSRSDARNPADGGTETWTQTQPHLLPAA